jgi:hypothetical protein
MGAHANPDIIDDSLVFMYDTDDVKSYKGEPTTNLITNSGTSNTGWAGHGWTGSQAISNDYPNTYEFTATNGWHNRTFDTGVTSGGTIYVSFQYKLKQQQTTQNQIFVLNGTHLGSYTNYIGNGSMSFEWKTFSGSFTANTNSSKIAIGPRGQDSSGLTDIVYIRNLQVEQKPHATQFVNGTRSATQGLIDRTGTATINISSASFDSNAQMTFDGTNDHVSLGNPTAFRDLTAGTIETVYYRDASSSTYQMIFTDAGSDLEINYSANVLQFYIGNSGLSYTHAVTDQWFNVVGTWGANFKKLYINGVEVASGGNTGTDTGSRDRYLGGRGANFPFNGKIPIAKIYNRTLTDKEIMQNYNATKGRFQ